MAHVIERDSFGIELYLLYVNLGTNPDKNAEQIEKVLERYGFSIEVHDTTPVMFLYDKIREGRVPNTEVSLT